MTAPSSSLRDLWPLYGLRLTLEGWRARPRPEVTVEGLEGCLDLFGNTPR